MRVKQNHFCIQTQKLLLLDLLLNLLLLLLLPLFSPPFLWWLQQWQQQKQQQQQHLCLNEQMILIQSNGNSIDFAFFELLAN